MVETYLRRSPLAHRGLAARAAVVNADADIVMGERPHLCQINLRGNADDGRFTEALHSVTGLRLPAEANSFSAEAALACLWLGPDEWLTIAAKGNDDRPRLAPGVPSRAAVGHTGSLASSARQAPAKRDRSPGGTAANGGSRRVLSA